MNLYPLLKPLLFSLPAERSHHLALSLLERIPKVCLPSKHNQPMPLEYQGIVFQNKVGLAAGLDKNGDYLEGLSKLGFGFIEVGTVTPKPQTGNPQPRLFRLVKNQAIINRMGFNNKGVDYLVSRLQNTQYRGTLGVNIGKNKQTPNEKAIDDYLYCLNKVFAYASYITVNISSPNTPGLRELQQKSHLERLLSSLKEQQAHLQSKFSKKVPLLVKVSPDERPEQLEQIADAVLGCEIEGVIATNTTVSRASLSHERYVEEQGGLSGMPLYSSSTQAVRLLRQRLGVKPLIIGVGGISTSLDAIGKLEAGADLIQVYTGLIYQGPHCISKLIEASSKGAVGTTSTST